MATVTYKCPNCDGGLIFNPGTQDFECEYCTSHFSQTELELSRKKEEEQKKAEQQEQEEGAALYSCPSCGAEVVAEETTAATFCYYCHNPVVLSERLGGKFEPDYVIPFAIDKIKAVNSFLAWARQKKFVPEDFTSSKQIEKISGVYFPYWMLDSQLHMTFQAQGTKERTWRTGDRKHTETKYYHVFREGEVRFTEVIKDAMWNEHRELIQGVLPFTISEAKKFEPAYLSGFRAEKRTIETKELEEEVNRQLEDQARSVLRSSVEGYTTVTSGDARKLKDTTNWNYTLMPVWILTYRSRNKELYYFAMNGQNGKVNGELPLDKGKLLKTSALISAAVFGIYLIGIIGGLL